MDGVQKRLRIGLYGLKKLGNRYFEGIEETNR